MSVFSKAKKLLLKSDACVVSTKNGEPQYVIIRWGKWKDIKNEIGSLKKNQNKELEEDSNYDVDINDIPV